MTKTKLTQVATQILGNVSRLEVSCYKAGSRDTPSGRAFVSVYLFWKFKGQTRHFHVVSYNDTPAKACDKMHDLLQAFATNSEKTESERCYGKDPKADPNTFVTEWHTSKDE